MANYRGIVRDVALGNITDKRQLQLAKKRLAKELKLPELPGDADILEQAGKHRGAVLQVLRRKPMRTLSGVAPVAVMTRPSRCPHGKCIYCCGGVEVGTPQSYTGREPAALRGRQYAFDGGRQAAGRIEQLEAIGHPADKVELIVMGGTFTSQPLAYQRSFIRSCFNAMNGKRSRTIAQAQELNERAKHRCIGLTIETRPDWCRQREIRSILGFGATRVELGVQNPDDAIYRQVKRGHSVADVAQATALLKDSGLKVGYHLMTNLPGSSPAKDRKMFRRMFEDKRFRPDMLKIYPCLLIRPEYGKTVLYDMYMKGKWKPYSEEETVSIIADAKKYFPRWVRVMRVERDIPAQLILAGPRHSNLRELVARELARSGARCSCIRCREIKGGKAGKAELLTEQYRASGGRETFLSYEDNGRLLGFLRLRFPAKPFMPQVDDSTALVRELHVYGQALPIGAEAGPGQQHRGLGERLLAEAEQVAADAGYSRLAITSGVGVRGYYRRLGYSLDSPYMAKRL
jgi:elongator complex protein 3